MIHIFLIMTGIAGAAVDFPDAKTCFSIMALNPGWICVISRILPDGTYHIEPLNNDENIK